MAGWSFLCSWKVSGGWITKCGAQGTLLMLAGPLGGSTGQTWPALDTFPLWTLAMSGVIIDRINICSLVNVGQEGMLTLNGLGHISLC